MSPAPDTRRARVARRLAGTVLVAAAAVTTAVGARPPLAAAAAATTTTEAATPKVCSDARAFDDATKALAGIERGDLAGAAAVVHEATQHFVDGSKRAPSGIAADYKLMAKALGDLDTALTKAAKAGGDEQATAVSELIATVQRLDADPGLIAASGRLQEWILSKCNEVLSAVDPYATTTVVAATGKGAKATTTRKATTTTRKATTTTRKATTTTRKAGAKRPVTTTRKTKKK